jgi:hypothetical protein
MFMAKVDNYHSHGVQSRYVVLQRSIGILCVENPTPEPSETYCLIGIPCDVCLLQVFSVK